MIPGAGWISGGPGYRQWFSKDQVLLEGSTSYSLRGYKAAQARFELPKIALACEYKQHIEPMVGDITKLLSIAEEVADRIGVIHRGKLQFLGTVQEIKNLAGDARLSLEESFFRLTL